jgi:hypothetical protein
MFGMLTSLAKAAVGAVVAPVALAADVVTLPATAGDLHRGPFDSTPKVLSNTMKNLQDAVDPKKG